MRSSIVAPAFGHLEEEEEEATAASMEATATEESLASGGTTAPGLAPPICQRM